MKENTKKPIEKGLIKVIQLRIVNARQLAKIKVKSIKLGIKNGRLKKRLKVSTKSKNTFQDRAFPAITH